MAVKLDAWHQSPHEYVEQRDKPFGVSLTPRSRYVAMPDGCRLAVDVYLPQVPAGGDAPGPFPAITIFTPYYRRFALADSARHDEVAPGAFRYRNIFVPAGYALVVIDVRGTGASFGTRDSFRSPRERDDCKAIADWIVAQPWSNGTIGATGVSLPGRRRGFPGEHRPSGGEGDRAPVRGLGHLCRPLLSGGVHLKELALVYDELMVAMDHDRRDLLKKVSYYANPNYAGRGR